MGYIYMITNDINNKKYIGQTINNVQARFTQHKIDARNDSQLHFHRAIRKYGESHFQISIIEECENDILNDREKYWINYYDSYNKGYNSTLGGDGHPKYNITTEQVGKLWDEGFSITEIANKLNISRGAVKIRISAYPNYKKEKSIARGIQKTAEKKYIPVYQWSGTGELIAKYKSGIEAEQKTGYDRKAISSAIVKNTFSNGFLWTHGETPVFKHRIGQYDLEGNFIKFWTNATEAGKALKCDSSSIRKCCKGKSKTCHNFIWKEEK